MPFGRPERCKCCAAAPHNLHKRQSLLLGVQACRLAGLKGVNPALGGSSLPVAGMTAVNSAQQLRTLPTRCRGHQLCRQSLFLEVQACRLAALKGVNPKQRLHTACNSVAVALFLGFKLAFGRHDRCKLCAATPHSLQKRCRGHQLRRQSLFLGVQACRLAGLKGVNPAQRLRTPCTSAAVATNCAGRVFSWRFKRAVWQR